MKFIFLFLIFFAPMFSVETAKQGQAQYSPKAAKIVPTPKKSQTVDYDIILKTSAGGLFNYLSYKVNSPLASASVYGHLDINLTQAFYIDLAYKAEGEKNFEPVPGTTNTLDQVRQFGQIIFGFHNDILGVNANMKYNWMIRPSWPDLYQPNPLRYGGATDPNYGSLLPTDRNSYHRLEPGLFVDFTGIKRLPLELKLVYTRNLEYIDPNYSLTLPTHLEPSTYSGYSAEIGGAYEISDMFHIELQNKSEYRAFDYELARDAITGKTNYRTTPNPFYNEFNNKTSLGFSIKFSKLALEFKPFFSLETNSDLYQGYYSYTAIEPGIAIEHKIGNFRYALKFSEDLENYGPNSFDPLKTTDRNPLFKYYTKGEVNLKYRFNKHFESFIEAGMVIKQTNYPPYVPGVNPASKNYDIDFNYENFMVRGGVSYRL